MSVQRHHDENSLVTMLGPRVVESDPHLAGCGNCAERLEDYRLLTDSLRDAATWDQRVVSADPNPNTIAALRAFADTMAAEDAAAERYLSELLDGPRETWMAKLDAHPEWRTAGVVRALIGHMPALLDSMPSDAVECARVATAIVEGWPSDTQTALLRGAAWREQAYALFYVGRYSEAEVAATRADEILATAAVSEFDRARVGTVRALIDRAMERLPSAFHAVRTSAETFLAFGDLTRETSAALAHAHLLITVQRFDEAFDLLAPLERRLRDSNDVDSHARVLGNLGACCSRLGLSGEAIRYYDLAATLFSDLGVHTEAVRVKWNMASILAAEGRVDDALVAFHDVRGEFSRLGMVMQAALVGLEIAEIMLSREQYVQVDEICQTSMRAFETGGIPYGAGALTALAFIREASRACKATPELARHVRRYLLQLPQNETVLFAPPPL